MLERRLGLGLGLGLRLGLAPVPCPQSLPPLGLARYPPLPDPSPPATPPNHPHPSSPPDRFTGVEDVVVESNQVDATDAAANKTGTRATLSAQLPAGASEATLDVGARVGS